MTGGCRVIKESEVADFMGLIEPDSRFLHHYLMWALQRTEAPAAYAVGTGLAVIAAVAPPNLRLDRPETLATYWPMLVGTSGSCRKTTAIRQGVALLTEVEETRILQAPSSPQGLAEELIGEYVTGLMSYGELGDFLAGSARPGPLRDVRARLLALWDGDDIPRRLAGKSVTAKAPRVSVLAGVAPPLLEAHTDSEDWTGGLMSRFVVFYAERERRYPRPPDASAFRPAAVEGLQGLLVHAAITTPVDLEPAAEARFVEFDGLIDALYRESPHAWTAGIAARAPGVALKTALLVAHDRHVSTLKRWMVDDKSMEAGCMVALWHLESAIELVEKWCGSGWGRLRQSVLDVIEHKPVSLAVIIRRTVPKRSKKDIEQVLESLEAEEAITKVYSGVTAYYTRKGV